MVNVFSVALSGLAASEKRIGVSASNTANASTPDFKAKEVKQTANAGGGTTAHVVERDPATITTVDAQGNLQELPNTSPEQELVEQEIATYTFKANLQVIKKQKEIEEALLDIQA